MSVEGSDAGPPDGAQPAQPPPGRKAGNDAGADQISTAAGLPNPAQQAAALTLAAELGAPFVERCLP